MVDSNNALTAAVQGDFTSITAKVFKAGAQVGATMTVTVASAVYNTVQTGSIWTADPTGFNFKHTVSRTYFSEGDGDYIVEYVGVLVSGYQFVWKFIVTTHGIGSS